MPKKREIQNILSDRKRAEEGKQDRARVGLRKIIINRTVYRYDEGAAFNGGSVLYEEKCEETVKMIDLKAVKYES